MSLAIPVVFVQLGFMAMGAVDTLMVGRLSATMLAAVALGNLYFFNVSIFGAGHADGARSARRAGHRRERHGRRVARDAARPRASRSRCRVRRPRAARAGGAGAPRAASAGGDRPRRRRAICASRSPASLPFLAFVVLRQSLQAMHRVAPIVWTIVVANAAERRRSTGCSCTDISAARRSASRGARSRRRSAAGS